MKGQIMRTALAVVGVGLLGAMIGVAVGRADPPPPQHQQAELAGWSVLAATATRAGSPPSGAFFTAQNLATRGRERCARLRPTVRRSSSSQPVQGISATDPCAATGSWWALADNGYGTRDTSADWQLPIYRIDPGPRHDERARRCSSTVVLSDPHGYVPWKTVCDPTVGTDLPPFSFNVLPATTPRGLRHGPGGPAAHRLRLRPGVDRARRRRHVLDRRGVRPVPAARRPAGTAARSRRSPHPA